MLSLGILGTAGAVAGLGTFAQFTDSTTATHAVSSGTVDIEMAAAGVANRLSESSTLIAAGDTIQRAVDLDIAGTLELSSITLASSTANGSDLTSDAVDGLQLQVDRCSVPWTESGAANARTYTCSGTTAVALASGPVLQPATALTNLGLAGGSSEHLRMTWTLPSTANNDDHGGDSSTIDYDFVGVQRAATNR